MRQEQFLNVLDPEDALSRWLEAMGEIPPLPEESVPLDEALGRVLSRDLPAPFDVPGFDRSDVDGFAVMAEDTWGASESEPVTLRLNDEILAAGDLPGIVVAPGTATPIATGGVVPRGADAVVMVEHTDCDDSRLIVRRAVVPGDRITYAGTDIGRGETVLRAGDPLTARETGILAACGLVHVPCHRRLRVAVLSTGSEIVAPGEELREGQIYDANARAVADALREMDAEPEVSGPIPDDPDRLRAALGAALDSCDVVLLSGGTSKGAGDLNYRLLKECEPGIVAHGVALKPGKPLCLAVADRTPVALLPGFPTSALFTFHDIVAPVLRRLSGLPERRAEEIAARLAVRIPSVRGRREYALVSLVSSPSGPVAFPIGKGSGSVTTWARADGYTVVESNEEGREPGARVRVRLLGRGIQAADLVVIGSHCTGLDLILRRIRKRGFTSKLLSVGSSAGLEAAKRGECDIAPVHLLDPESGTYNEPFLDESLVHVPGYRRTQGLLFRRDHESLAATDDAAGLLDLACEDPGYRMVNRQRGSGTRILVDQMLGDRRPAGYTVEARSHNAVAAAVAQGRADWGPAISSVAHTYGLGFHPLAEEQYDFVVPRARENRPAVLAFLEALSDETLIGELEEGGFTIS